MAIGDKFFANRTERIGASPKQACSPVNIVMRHFGIAFVLVLLFSPMAEARGQVATPLQVPPLQVTLGDGSVELSGRWRFHPGDDMTWAEVGFDDSKWPTLDLTPPTDPGSGGFVEGWTDNGYQNLSGFAWYRLRVDVQNPGDPLAIKMPNAVDDAYQVFVNGQRIGDFGRFTSRGVSAYSSIPRAFPLPRQLRSGPMTIAVRMWMDAATPFNSPDAGGMHGPPILGHRDVIASQIRLDKDDILHDIGVGYLEMLILVITWIIAVGLLWLDPAEPAYLWLSLVCLGTIVSNGIVLVVNSSTWITQTPQTIFADVISGPIRIGLWVLFWGYWFRTKPIRWLHWAVWTLVFLLMIGTALLRAPLYGPTVPVKAAAYLFPFLLTIKLALAALLFALAFRGIRKQRAEGWLALSVLLLVTVSLYQRELRLIHIRTGFVLFEYRISLGTISTILSLFLITIMLLRRYLHAQQRREQWKTEIEQARQVQHVLMPEKLPRIPGFEIESDYRPAREVGGDFFQILPGPEPGGILIIVGDVTGKGLQAGMLVALIVGAIRTEVQYHADPFVLMNNLNDRLCGRDWASATCLILQITSDGEATLVNAGHLPPYLNGNEMMIEGSLPIGVLREAEFSLYRFNLLPGDTLVLLSDGVAEAQDHKKQLFGFERISALLQKPISAATLASAAQRFGQEDDILVLKIRRELHSGSVRDTGTLLAHF